MDSHQLILASVARYIELDAREQEIFTSLLVSKTIKKHEFLLRQGEVCKTENFIVKGCLRKYTIDENGQDHIILFGVEDWWMSDLYSFLTQNPSPYFVDALEDSEVLQITREKIDFLYEAVPKFERFFRILLQNTVIAHQRRINQNLSMSAKERYLDFISQCPTIEQRLSQKQIASYLGITPVFLSMLRKELSGK